MRFTKRAVLATALAVAAMSTGPIANSAHAEPQSPGGSTLQKDVDGYTLWTKLTTKNATCTNTAAGTWSVDWVFSAMVQSPEFTTTITGVSIPLGGELAAGNTLSQPKSYPASAYRANTFTSKGNYTGTADVTETVNFINTIKSGVGTRNGSDVVDTYTVKSPCASELVLGRPPIGSGVFVPLEPGRVLDTRNGTGKFAIPEETRSVKILGEQNVPVNGVTAVVLNVTATQAATAGFVTVWPQGDRPTASNLNLDGPGSTVANLVTVPVGVDGTVRAYNNSGSHLIFDVMGYYRSVTTSQRAGRYQPVPLTRLVDTRSDGGAPAAGQSLRVQVAASTRVAIPADATAAVLNVTAVNSRQAGFTTVYPWGITVPNTSNLNTNHEGETRANQVIVKLGADGAIGVFSDPGSDVLVDVAGYFTSGSAGLSRSGFFVPSDSGRAHDTRETVATIGKPGLLATRDARAGEVFKVDMSYAGSVVVNVTAVNATNTDFLTVYQSGEPLPITSTINVEQGNTAPNHATTALGISADIAVFTHGGADIIVDDLGWYTK